MTSDLSSKGEAEADSEAAREDGMRSERTQAKKRCKSCEAREQQEGPRKNGKRSEFLWEEEE